MTNTAPQETEGRLAENIVYFARALRAAGLPVGPGAGGGWGGGRDLARPGTNDQIIR